MKHIDLYSGIGGFSLACDWVGIETIGFVEIDPFCQKVLKKHWPGVPIVEDVNNVEEIKRIVTNAYHKRQSQPERIIKKFGRRTLDRNQQIATDTKCRRTEQGYGNSRQSLALSGSCVKSIANANQPLLLTAGFPCQPFSNAGRKRGASDDRYLWPQTLAVIESVKPDWIVLENVAGLTNMVFPGNVPEMAIKAVQAIRYFNLWGWIDFPKTRKIQIPFTHIQQRILGRIINDCEKAGYDFPRTTSGEPIVLCVPACAVSAPHRRDRVWIVANTSKQGLQGEQSREPLRLPGQPDRIGGYEIPNWEENWYEVATRFCRVDDGLPDRLARYGVEHERLRDKYRKQKLEALGNSIVPAVAYEIIKAIVEVDEANK